MNEWMNFSLFVHKYYVSFCMCVYWYLPFYALKTATKQGTEHSGYDDGKGALGGQSSKESLYVSVFFNQVNVLCAISKY